MFSKSLKKKSIIVLSSILLLYSAGNFDVFAKSWDYDNAKHTDVVFSSSVIPNGNRKITLTFRDTDIQQVLRMLADKAGMNVIFGDKVEGTVTMDLVNVTLDRAFKMLIEMKHLAYFKDGDTFMIMNAEDAFKSNIGRSEMRIIPVKYANAVAVANFLNANVFGLAKPGLSAGKTVTTNPAKNEVIVFGSRDDYDMALRVIKKMDVKPTSTVYKINHVTPKEMASLICNTLFPGQNSSNNTASVSQPKIAGTLTGAASSSYSGSGSGSSSRGSRSLTGAAPSNRKIELGGGTIACKVNANASSGQNAGGLVAFNDGMMSVVYHQALGTITLMGGSAEQISMVNEFITLHDKKQQQAVLEFVVMELKEEATHEFENNWVFNNGSFPIKFSDGALTLGKLLLLGDRSGAPQSFGTGERNLSLVINWVEENDKGRILQNPKIIVTGGRESIIDMTQDYVSKTEASISTASSTLMPIIERDYDIGDDLGMKISVVPFISPDGYVTMDLKVDYSVEAGKVYQTLYNQYSGEPLDEKELAATLLKRRNLALNTIRVKSGETLVLGGLIYETETDNVKKIPILGDIPFLGVFFRNTITTKQKNELVLLITPRIIEDTEDIQNL